MTFPLPADEQARLRALDRHAILDTPPEREFDRLTSLAARTFGLPTALFTLVEGDRQWFKSRYGFAPEQSARAVAFCAHTITSRRVMVVPDALKDPRFCNNPMVVGAPRIRFYAGAPLRDRDGPVIGAFAVLDYRPRAFSEEDARILADFADITVDQLRLRLATTRARQAERSSLEQLGAIVSAAPLAIATLSNAGVVWSWNAGAERALGIPASEAIGTRLDALLPSIAPAVAHPMEHELTRGREVAVTRRDGSDAVFRVTVSLLQETLGDDGLLVIAEDVTEAKRLAAGLVRADRLAALGTMAAGIAHEINNPLMCIVGSVEYASRAVRAPEDIRSFEQVGNALREVEAGVERVRDIVRGLGVFSRRPDEATTCDPARALDASLKVTATQVCARATLQRDYGPLPRVGGTESRLSQVFINLLLNAAHAIPLDDQRSHVVAVRARAVADRVVIEVGDTGRGIPAAAVDHVFEPFFTTKEEGLGTGLGLFVSHQIITSVGGTIDVESQVDHGTTFRVTLPVAAVGPVTQA